MLIMARREKSSVVMNDLRDELYQGWTILGHEHKEFYQVVGNL